MTPLRRFASSPLEGGTAPVARLSRFHGVCWMGTLLFASVPVFAASPSVEVVANGLQNPWGLAFIGEGRMLVTERPGRMRIVEPDGHIGAPLAGVPKVDAGGQGGLLDVVTDSQFERNRTIYFCFSEPGAGGNSTALASARLSDDATKLEDVKVVFSQKPKFAARVLNSMSQSGRWLDRLAARTAVSPARRWSWWLRCGGYSSSKVNR